MRIAISGSHNTGKSTLIAAFAARRPRYVCEPEAFELLGDEIAMTASEGPDVEGLAVLLEHTVSVLASYAPGDAVLFERSPVDYLAYAAASESMDDAERDDFLRVYVPKVRASLRDLDMIVLLPVSDQSPILARPGEDEDFRQRVDEELRRALVDDEHDLLADAVAPIILELSPFPERQLEELMRRAGGPS